MFALILLLQAGTPVARDTATYSTSALRQLVSEASALNHRVPPALGRYTAQLESEISLGLRDGEAGREVMTSVEQVASSLTWQRTGDFEQHVTGYRSQSLGPQFATIGFFRDAWAVPSLYGNRLALLFGRDSTTQRPQSRGARPGGTRQWAVHPLADDREKVYRYSGGDTVEALTLGDRTIRIVRIDVTPRSLLPVGTVVFSGEVDLDASRKHVVRMRGSFAQAQPVSSTGLSALVRSPVRFEAIAFVELVNAEINGEFWLPQYQRFEGQALAPLLGEGKAVFRILSRFSRYDVLAPAPAQSGDLTSALIAASAPPPVDAVAAAPLPSLSLRPLPSASDTLRARPHRLSFAPTDSLSRFDRWREEIGSASSSVSSEDFVDVAPPKWRPTGPPVFSLQTERFQDFVHINRIEGPFTGAGLNVRFRDAAPGVTVRANAGYAWSEGTVRGRASAELARGPWRFALRGGRSLDPTNDFTNGLDSIATLGALFGVDRYDYVDRWSAGAQASRLFGGNSALLRLELGWANDRSATQHLARGLLGRNRFVPNRPVDEGEYARSALTLEWHPNVQAEFLRTGTGATLHYVRGDGPLRFQRVEARVTTRRNVDAWTFAARLDAGAAFGRIPTQQLFEMGSELRLPGYEYKEFTGNQAASARGLAMFRLGWLRSPVRVYRQYWLPAPDPSLAVTIQAGWTGASGADAWDAMRRLTPTAKITDGVRSSVSAGIRFFGGAIGFSVARPIDHEERWRLRVEFGQRF